eukprot:TRINITY_DN9808_c0_g1_i2.p1 TRINITY_DN9808_c0_g1~~TRINITY_DN9808_c0_g1_i2.p1  ORF type:complete len:666 (-),score=175.87 TRINITY_DN9808_c0_g1_i2:117-2114(-)
MEVLVTEHGLPEDAIVSIRFGTTRRQAPLETVCSHPLKFPSSLEEICEPLKIDVLKPIATTRLVLHPHEDQYTIGLEQSSMGQTLSQEDCGVTSDMYIGLNIKPSMDGKSGSRPDSAMPAKFQDAAASAKDYLEEHGLLRYVQSLLHAVIQVKPKDPYAFMMEQLGASKSKAASVRSRPTSAVGGRTLSRPTSALPAGRQPIPPPGPPPGPGESSPLRQIHGPSSGTAVPGQPGALPEAKPPEEPLLESVPAPKATPPPLSEEPASQQKPSGDSERQQLQIASSPLQAEQPVAELKPPGEAAQQQLQAEPSSGIPVKAELDLEEIRLRMKDVFEKAHSTGQLEKAVDAVLGNGQGPALPLPPVEVQPENPPHDTLELKRAMRTLLEESVRNGQLEEAIKKVQVKSEVAPAPAVAEIAEVKAVTEETAEIKSKLRTLLSTALSNGQLENALHKMSETAKPQTQAQVKLQDLLQEASTSGKLDEAFAAAKKCSRPSSPMSQRANTADPDFAQAKARLEAMLDEAAESKEVDSKVMPGSLTEDDIADTKAKLRRVLQEASDSGQLEAALQAMSSQKVSSAQAKEMLKVKLREVMREATESGKLEEALRKVTSKRVEGQTWRAEVAPSLEDVKADLRSALQAATESGRLAVALQEAIATKQGASLIPAT